MDGLEYRRTTVAHAWRKDLPRIRDPRGNLSVIESGRDVPFPIERVFWIYDVPGGETRGAKADRVAEEFVVALSGGFRVLIDDATERTSFLLNRSYWGLYLPPRIWRYMDDFSTNAVALVLSSCRYDPATYITDYDEFRKMKRAESE
jgi:WxcM-like, C-terminal